MRPELRGFVVPRRLAARQDGVRLIEIGLVGCGRIAQLVHLRELGSLSGLRLTALAEPDPDQLSRAAALAPGARQYADYHDLLGQQSVDAVILSLSPDLHADAAIASFEAGKHVYLEKPLATDLESAEDVLEAHRRAGLVGMMGFNFRFHPSYRLIRKLLAEGAIGDVVALRTAFSSVRRSLPAWKKSRGTGGGVLLDLGSHHIDILRFVTSAEVSEVSARIRSRRSEADTALLQLKLTSGLEVQSFFSLTGVAEDLFEAIGENGKLSFERYANRFTKRPEVLPTARAKVLRRESSHFTRALRGIWQKVEEPSFRNAFDAFAHAVEGDLKEIPTLEDGYRCLEVVDAAERSAASGRVTRLPERGRHALGTGPP